MKKSLVAMAVLAATGAFAQSSVTLYGRMDLGLASGTTDTTTVGGPTTSVRNSELAGAQNNWTGSRLGVRGSEDLGGGLKANFVYEFRLHPDNTTAGSTNFGATRTALLQVAGGFGSVTIGTYLNPFDDVRLSAGIYGGAGTGNIPGAWTLDKVNSGFLNARSVNSIAYRSPVFAGGFTASIGTTMQDSGSTNSKSTGYIASVGYANGPINALVAYGEGKQKTSTPGVGAVIVTPNIGGFATPIVITPATVGSIGENRIKDFGLRASYNFGVAVPYISYETLNVNATNLISGFGAGGAKSRGYEIGSTFPMGAFTPFILFANQKTSPFSPTITTSNATTNAFQLGTKYDLSKRTFVYGGYGRSNVKNDNNINKISDVRSTGYGLGLVHNF